MHKLRACHHLQDVVEFRINVSFEELQRLLADAVGGLHTMLDEHFGISIVEYMAAGKDFCACHWSPTII